MEPGIYRLEIEIRNPAVIRQKSGWIFSELAPLGEYIVWRNPVGKKWAQYLIQSVERSSEGSESILLYSNGTPVVLTTAIPYDQRKQDFLFALLQSLVPSWSVRSELLYRGVTRDADALARVIEKLHQEGSVSALQIMGALDTVTERVKL